MYNKLDFFSPLIRSLLRIVASLIFFAHGCQKIFGFPASDRAFPEIFSKLWFAGILELVGGALLFIGLFSRPVAFILSGMMAVAYWTIHAPNSPFPVLNNGDAAILYCFIFLYIFFAGPGPLSIDARTHRDH